MTSAKKRFAGSERVMGECDSPILRAAQGAYQARRERSRLFGPNLFSDPAWDLLLYLFLASGDGRGVTVTEACQAASVPTSTALRWIGHLVDRKLLLRVSDPDDRRAVRLYLSNTGRHRMADFFARFAIYGESPLP